MKKCFIQMEGEQLGPFDLEELKSQNINGNTRVWCEGMSNWQKANQVEEISTMIKSFHAENRINYATMSSPPFVETFSLNHTKSSSKLPSSSSESEVRSFIRFSDHQIILYTLLTAFMLLLILIISS